MGAIKITPADSAFSKCVRERAEWKCERCGAQHDPSSTGLHCSHFHGRGKWGVRFEPLNGEALCYGCHAYLGAHPLEHREHKLELIGDHSLQILQEKANDTSSGRQARREQKEIAKHYREELKRMQSERANGVTGRIEFVGYL